MSNFLFLVEFCDISQNNRTQINRISIIVCDSTKELVQLSFDVVSLDEQSCFFFNVSWVNKIFLNDLEQKYLFGIGERILSKN